MGEVLEALGGGVGADDGGAFCSGYQHAAHDVWAVSPLGFNVPVFCVVSYSQGYSSLSGGRAVGHKNMIAVGPSCMDWGGFWYLHFCEDCDVDVLFIKGAESGE